MTYPYKVTCQFGDKKTDTPCAEFKELNDAKMFIEKKLELDSSMNLKVIYRLHEFQDVIEEFNSASVAADQGSQGKTSSASFKPTPFNMSPSPKGLPKKWIHDADEEEGKK